MKKTSRPAVSHFVLAALVLAGLVDLAGFAFGLFYGGIFYDNLAHLVTSFALVALAAELYAHYGARVGGQELLFMGRRAIVAGAILGLCGGIVWEAFEAVLDHFYPETIYSPPVDSVVDTLFGTIGGAAGAWRTANHLHGVSLRRLLG